MASRTRIAICLLRNDLRFHDNEALQWANKNSTHVLPLYCFDPRHFGGTYHFNFPKTGSHRLKLLLQTVTDLRQTLRNKGSDLIVRHGKPEVVVSELVQRIGSENVSTVTFHTEVTDEEVKVENAIKEKSGVKVETFWGHTLYHKDDLPFSPKHSWTYLVRRSRALKKSQKITDTWTYDGLIFIKHTDGNIVHVRKHHEMAAIEALCGLEITYPMEPFVLPDVYTQFRKRVEGQSPIRKCIVMPDKLNPLPEGIEAGDIPTVQQLGGQEAPVDDRGVMEFKGGETVALERLQHYLFGSDSVATYKETRNGLIGADYSTKFSMWLAFGSLSPRHIYWEIKRYESERVSNQSTYWVIFELIWRDYFRFVAFKYGNQIFQLEGIQGKHIQWKQDKDLFNAWKDGRTGVPFVDANMRELAATGFMSNRGRQNVASFLTKDLKLDWRLGAEWFESMLIDHDVCSNYGNWLYSAGIGNDPREDRKFNMVKQGLDYDPEGDYIRLWIPELAGVKGGVVHTVWTMGNGALSTAGVSLGETYPKPVVIAPEWSRHFGKKSGSARGGGRGGGGRGGGSQPKQNRGIDFYFKGQSSGKR